MGLPAVSVKHIGSALVDRHGDIKMLSHIRILCINTAPSDYLKALMIHLSFLFLFLFQLLYVVVIMFCINRIQLCCLMYSILYIIIISYWYNWLYGIRSVQLMIDNCSGIT